MPVSLDNWPPGDLYKGWSADRVLDATVIGKHGEEVGHVKNLLIDRNGQIAAVIAEIGGVFDIGDTHIAVPWRDVELQDDGLHSPITEESAELHGLFKDEFYSAADVHGFEGVTERLTTGPSLWKATSLLDDYVILSDGRPYGYVTDLIFGDDGRLLSVVVNSANAEFGRMGVFPFPWNGYRNWRPALDYYALPYTPAEIKTVPMINYARFD
jgi:sporulation protein YlmC with PRC-barrel domain